MRLLTLKKIQELVKYIYEEATNSLTTKVSVEITGKLI
jgi:hypothetical protein